MFMANQCCLGIQLRQAMLEDHSTCKMYYLRLFFSAALLLLVFASPPVLAGKIVVKSEIQRQSEYTGPCQSKTAGKGHGPPGRGGEFDVTNSTYDVNITEDPRVKPSKAFVPETKSLNDRLSYGFWFADSRSLDIPDNGVVNWLESRHSRGAYSLLADIKYHFVNESVWVPYLGLQAGAVVSRDMHGKRKQPSSIGGGALAGIEAFLTESTSIFAEYNFLAFRRGSLKGHGDANGDNDTAYQNGVLIGFQYYW